MCTCLCPSWKRHEAINARQLTILLNKWAVLRPPRLISLKVYWVIRKLTTFRAWLIYIWPSVHTNSWYFFRATLSDLTCCLGAVLHRFYIAWAHFKAGLLYFADMYPDLKLYFGLLVKIIKMLTKINLADCRQCIVYNLYFKQIACIHLESKHYIFWTKWVRNMFFLQLQLNKL